MNVPRLSVISLPLIVGLVVFWPNVRVVAAEAFVAHVTPPVAQRGKTSRLTFHGTNLGKPIDLWTSLSKGQTKAMPAPGGSSQAIAYDVQVAADAPVGVHGVRVATADGLSNLLLFYVDDLPVSTMPNSTSPVAHLPACFWGTFQEAVVERVAIEATTGQKIGFEVVANRMGKDVDPLLTIRNSRGHKVVEVDNSPGLGFDCRFEHTFAEGGTHTVEIRDSRFRGNAEGHYLLRMGKLPAARVAVPSAVRAGERSTLRLPEIGDRVSVDTAKEERPGPFSASIRRLGDDGSVDVPLTVTTRSIATYAPPPRPKLNDAIAPYVDALTLLGHARNPSWLAAGLSARRGPGTAATVPGILCGVLEKPGQENNFWLHLKRGERIRITGQCRSIHSPIDLEMVLTDGLGREVARAADNAQDEPLTLEYGAGADGCYGLHVRDLSRDGGPAYAYLLDVAFVRPLLQLNAEVEGLTVPRGSYQVVPISLVRKDYTGPVLLSLEGAPGGVTLSSTEIGKKESSIVCKLSASPTAPLGVSTVRILARPVIKLDTLAVGAAIGLNLPPAAADAITPRFTVTTKPLIDRQLHNVDLIPIGLREDQRRPPFAVTDRFALQITPPAPFTMETPESLVTLYRYHHASFPVATTRLPGFDGPITFSAKGGQIAGEKEGRTRVFARFPAATTTQPTVTGSIHTRILVNLQKHRVEVTGVGTHQGRRVSLTRSFDLEIKPAFEVVAEPALQQVDPGKTTTVRLVGRRFGPFEGPITIELSQVGGIDRPEKVVIPKGQDSIEATLTVSPQAGPQRHSIQLHATGVVNGYEEENRSGRIEIEVRKPKASGGR